jgi:hypothetical protein
METTSTAVAVAEKPKAPVGIGYRGLEIKSLDDLWRVSNYIAKSGLAPKGIESPEAIFTALELGLELGLPPMAALQNIAVINGRPGVFGDVQLALVRASGLLEDYSETEIGNPKDDTWGVQCTCKRIGSKFANSTFTVADAKRAQLWGKSGPWSQYPKRMLKFRARGYLLRDEFGDVLKGVRSVEELRDSDPDNDEQRFSRAKRVNGTASAPPPPESSEAAPAPPPSAPVRNHPTLVEQPLTDDERAEALAGLAPVPVRAAVTPAPEQSSGPEMTESQAKLNEILTANGFTFGDLQKAGPMMIESGNKQSGIVAWDTYSGIEDFPERAAKFFITAQQGMLEQLRANRVGVER